MSTCGSGGGGITPASRFLRRRAAVRDLGRDAAADLDAFWAAAPRLYDFSQQQQPEEEQRQLLTRPPSPPPADAPAPSPCGSPGPITLLKRRSSPRPPPPSPPAARRSGSPEPSCTPPSCLLTLQHEGSSSRSPSRQEDPQGAGPRSPSPDTAGATPCLLLALQSTCVGWGATRRVEYPTRHRPTSRDVPGLAAVEGVAAARCGSEDQEHASSGGGAKKRKRLEEVPKEDEAVQESGREEKPVVPPNAGKSRSRNRRKARWSSVRRRRGATRRAKKAPRVVKEEQREEEAEAEAESSQDVKPAVVEAEKTTRRSRKRAGSSGRGRRPGAAAKRAKKTPLKKELAEEDEEVAESKPAVVEAEKTTRRSRKRAGSSGRGRRPGAAAKRAKKTPLKKELAEEDEEVAESKPAAAKRVKKTPPKKEKVEEELAEEEEEEAESKPAAAAPAPELGSPSGKVDRWSAWRYAAGEAALLNILRARGASAGKPAPRAELRAQARRHIGDTGLLDHLLRHVADKVPAGSSERVRRRYNTAGGLEYWLEPAELAATRREAGVDDPFWVPPSGWKLGDPVTPEARALEVQKQVDELAGELDVVKRQMKQLDSNLVQVSKEAYISWKGYDCMVKANDKLEKEVMSLEEKYENATQVNGELKELLLLLKEKYDTVLEKNDRLEEQMLALSTSFQSMKEDLLLQRIGEQPMLMLEQEPWEDKQEASGAGNQLADADAIDGSFSSNGAGGTSHGSTKRALRKCSVHICRRDGMLQWPKAESGGTATSPRELPEPLTPGGDLVITDFDAVINSLAPPSMDEYLMAEGLPTPTSASSTNASPKLPLLPAPALPVQVQSLPLHSTTVTMVNMQAVQPYYGDPNLQFRHMDTSSSSSGPCGAKALKLDAGAGGGGVGTELALATPTY